MPTMSKPMFPVTTAAGLLPFMDANHKRQTANTVFELCGGTQRLYHEADKDFRWFIETVWVKMMPRGAISVDQSNTAGSVDDLIDRMDKAKIIDVEPTEK